jgi:hypothetical protein
MQTKQFEAIDLKSLEQVAGGGRIARKIGNALRNIFEHVTIFVGGDTEGGNTVGGFTVSE